MPTAVWAGLGGVGLVATWIWLLRAVGPLRQTTLLTAWGWAVAGLTVWTLAWAAVWFPRIIPPGAADLLWYAAVVLMLAAAIAVLGAKRPGSRVWDLFVILPLLAVLGWPALYAWRDGWPPERLVLLTPALVAVGLVSVMGLGNYLGTRFIGSALLAGAAVASVIAPHAVRGAWLPFTTEARTAGTVCLALAAAAARRARSHVSESQTTGVGRFERVWIDYRDAFGLVWARRFQERFQDVAVRRGWPVTLEPEGVCLRAGSELSRETDAEIEQTFRWLLRRFVDPAWIEMRLGASPLVGTAHPTTAEPLAAALEPHG